MFMAMIRAFANVSSMVSSLPQASDIADAIAFAIAAPVAMNIGHMEITPTLQVMGGLQTAKPQTVENRPTENKAAAGGAGGRVA